MIFIFYVIQICFSATYWGEDSNGKVQYNYNNENSQWDWTVEKNGDGWALGPGYSYFRFKSTCCSPVKKYFDFVDHIGTPGTYGQIFEFQFNYPMINPLQAFYYQRGYKMY